MSSLWSALSKVADNLGVTSAWNKIKQGYEKLTGSTQPREHVANPEAVARARENRARTARNLHREKLRNVHAQFYDQYGLESSRNLSDVSEYFNTTVIPNSYREVQVGDHVISYYTGNRPAMGTNNVTFYIVQDNNTNYARRAARHGQEINVSTYPFQGYNDLNIDCPEFVASMSEDMKQFLSIIMPDGRRLTGAKVTGPSYRVISVVDEDLALAMGVTEDKPPRAVDCVAHQRRSMNPDNATRRLPGMFDTEAKLPGDFLHKFAHLLGITFLTTPYEGIQGNGWFHIPTHVLDTRGEKCKAETPQNKDNACIVYCLALGLFDKPFKASKIPKWKTVVKRLYASKLNDKYLRSLPLNLQLMPRHELKEYVIKTLINIKNYTELNGFDLDDMTNVELQLMIRIVTYGCDLEVRDHGEQDDKLRYDPVRWYRLRNPELHQFDRFVVALGLITTNESDPARFVAPSHTRNKKDKSIHNVLKQEELRDIRAVPLE